MLFIRAAVTLDTWKEICTFCRWTSIEQKLVVDRCLQASLPHLVAREETVVAKKAEAVEDPPPPPEVGWVGGENAWAAEDVGWAVGESAWAAEDGGWAVGESAWAVGETAFTAGICFISWEEC
jgi:hypothetical protein